MREAPASAAAVHGPALARRPAWGSFPVPGQASRLSLLRFSLLSLILAGVPGPGQAGTLQEAFDSAGPAGAYDKVLVLNAGERYTGGLFIGPVLSPISHELEGPAGQDVLIQGNGAVLDLEGGQICISYCENRLDIEDCVIINGNVRFRGVRTADDDAVPFGSVRYVTFYKPYDYGIRLQGAGDGVVLERNIVVDAVDTGPDYLYINGSPNDWLPTGTNVSFSVQAGVYGVPEITRNWSWHSDPERNAVLLAHYGLLCEYG